MIHVSRPFCEGMRDLDTRNRVVEKAIAYGACLAGITDVALLRKSPSYAIYGKLDNYNGVGTPPPNETVREKLMWPATVKSIIVIAVAHPEEKPELDWWREDLEGGTPGNRILMEINAKLALWLKDELGIRGTGLSYHIDRGGIFLKDAAALAGLGCIGKNNMLVTPAFGPRVRLRAMFVDESIRETDPIDFDPCKECRMPCRDACPQSAFSPTLYSQRDFKVDQSRAATGAYSRYLCNLQMKADVLASNKMTVQGDTEFKKQVKYCRKCETACPVGKRG